MNIHSVLWMLITLFEKTLQVLSAKLYLGANATVDMMPALSSLATLRVVIIPGPPEMMKLASWQLFYFSFIHLKDEKSSSKVE